MVPEPPIEILVIGDVHGDWDEVDRAFLEDGAQDAAIFVGDFGDEDVALVERISRLSCVKAVMLGNHDAWTSMSGRDLGRVRRQLELLGPAAIGYASLPVAGGRLALVGGRPFSWGGGFGRHKGIYELLYGIDGDVASTDRIVAEAAKHPDCPLVLVGHNGTRGLGARADSIFGCDFRRPASDWGDPDLRHALDRLRAEGGRRVLAVVAGHMHDQVHGGGTRERRAAEGGTAHFNAAVVPRHRHVAGGRLRHFLRLVLDLEPAAERAVVLAEDLWVDDRGTVAERRALGLLETEGAHQEHGHLAAGDRGPGAEIS